MKKAWMLVLLLSCWVSAQTSPASPAVTPAPQPVTATVVPVLTVGQNLLIQPARLEARINPGNSFIALAVTLFSRVATEVYVTSSDPRLLVSAGETGRVRLNANAVQNLNVIATAPHSGSLIIKNADGTVIATVPYTIAAPKMFNQSASAGYDPFGNTASLGYSISNVPTTPLGIGYSVNFAIGADFDIPAISSGSIGVSVRW